MQAEYNKGLSEWLVSWASFRAYPPEMANLYWPYRTKFSRHYWTPEQGSDYGKKPYQERAAAKAIATISQNPHALIAVFGPMMCGKTTTALLIHELLCQKSQPVLVVKHGFDRERAAGSNLENHPATASVPSRLVFNIEELVATAQNFPGTVIFDEAMFIGADNPEEVVGLAGFLAARKTVAPTVVCGLDLAFNRQPWPATPTIVKQADLILHQSPKCAVPDCPDVGFLTFRTYPDNLGGRRRASEQDPLIFVGAAQNYAPVCGVHNALAEEEAREFKDDLGQTWWQRNET